MPRKISHRSGRVALRNDLDFSAGPPSEFRIFRAGENPSEKGTFIFDDASALSVMDEYVSHGKPLLMDYNHGATFETPTPEQAMCSGEFTPEVRNGELWATNVKWTERAAALLNAREYRMFSPLFQHEGGRVTRLLNVALTNLPALDHITPLVAANALEKETTMTPEEIKKLQEENARLTAALAAKDGEAETVKLTALVGLKASATGEEARGVVAGLVSLRSKVRELTGKDGDAAALGAIEGWKAEAATAGTLKAEKEKIETESLSAEVKALLDQADKDRKVTVAERPLMEKAALAFGAGKASREGVEWLKSNLEARSPVAKTAPVAAAGGAGGTVALSAAQKRANKLIGVSDEDVIKFEEKRAADGRVRA